MAYKLYDDPKDRMREALHPFRKKYHRDFYALKDINLAVKKGEILGIVGKNGSGKSTLLKIISRVLHPTKGTVQVNGRISALLELGSGFNPEFTGMENIYFYGSILGFSRSQMDEKVGDILDFADIGQFIQQPVKTYSSGMKARLAFAVSTAADPEVLVIDEVLAVGDIKFQRKCFVRLEQFKHTKRTMLLVSHSLNTINQICDKVLLLHKGNRIDCGEPKFITNIYHKMLFGPGIDAKKVKVTPSTESGKTLHRGNVHGSAWNKEGDSGQVITATKKHNLGEIRTGTKKAEITDFGFVDQQGNLSTILDSAQEYTIFVRAIFHQEADDPIVGYLIKNLTGVSLSGTNTYHQKLTVPRQEKNYILEARFHITMWLAPGKYFLTVTIGKFEDMYDARLDALNFEVQGQYGNFPNSIVNLNPRVAIAQIFPNTPNNFMYD